MAERAVEFAQENLKELLRHHAHLIKDAKNQFEKLEDDLRLLKAFLKDSIKMRTKDEKLRELVRQIRNVVYEADDVVDTVVIQAAEANWWDHLFRFFRSFKNRAELAVQVESVCKKISDIYGRVDFACLKVEDGRPEKTEDPILRKENVVGFDDEVEKLMGYLSEKTQQLDVISIVGMPGLGKTTLAGKIFHDPRIINQFPLRIWIYVSREFTKKEIFLAILKKFPELKEDVNHKSDGELAELISDYLGSRKFLLVMDDVWAPADWGKLQIALPKKNKRGKVLITSRRSEVGRYANRLRDPHMLRFLTPQESSLLLQLEVYEKPEFPRELEDDGKRIAERCGGVPLTIVVIGGILVKKFSASNEVMQKSWRKVSSSFNTYLNDDPERHIKKVISLSYEELPYDHLRECFLYMGMFPEDFEIPAWELICMWIAEGLIPRKDNMSLEETGESYLQDLINRHLVRVDKFRADGTVKTCRIHDMLRDFCRNEAGSERENFFQEFKKSTDGGFQPPISDVREYRRICIHSNVLSFLSGKPHGTSVRSFVCFSKDEVSMPTENNSAIPTSFNLVRVLDVKPIKFTELPSNMYRLHFLRYIVLSFISNVLPAAFSKLWYLQTLIVYTNSQTLAIEADILNMKNLRHFKTNASATLPKTASSNKGSEMIQTLRTISSESCNEKLVDRAHNLKKLGIRGQLSLFLKEENGSFDSLRKLGELENLKLRNDLVPHSSNSEHYQLHGLPPAYKFPTQLRSLTLCGTSLDWLHMTVLGLLDKLEVLKLKNEAFLGKTWVATDGGFRRLEVLHIGRTNLQNWVASRHHFPRLKRLELKNCESLREVPIGLADIENFQLLDLQSSRRAAASAKRISGVKRSHEEQHSVCSSRRFKLSISPPEE